MNLEEAIDRLYEAAATTHGGVPLRDKRRSVERIVYDLERFIPALLRGRELPRAGKPPYYLTHTGRLAVSVFWSVDPVVLAANLSEPVVEQVAHDVAHGLVDEIIDCVLEVLGEARPCPTLSQELRLARRAARLGLLRPAPRTAPDDPVEAPQTPDPAPHVPV